MIAADSEVVGGGDSRGVVVSTGGGHCNVAVDGRLHLCRLRGRLKQGERRSQTVAVAGDRVRLSLPAGTGQDAVGVIEEVLPRRNRISRLAARRSGGRREQVLMSNLDQVVAVQSVSDPAPQSGFVDRLFVAAAHFGVGGILVMNKIDLGLGAKDRDRWNHFARVGYPVIWTSAEDGRGVGELRAALAGRTSLMLGASGVGKSSLLNAIDPDLSLKVAEVTRKTGLGRHTTTRTELFPVPGGGFIADSPGLRGFAPWDIDPVQVRDYFPEFQAAADDCRYRTCLHREEPDCGVKAAVSRGAIPQWRHAAYLQLVKEIEDRGRESGFRR